MIFIRLGHLGKAHRGKVCHLQPSSLKQGVHLGGDRERHGGWDRGKMGHMGWVSAEGGGWRHRGFYVVVVYVICGR